MNRPTPGGLPSPPAQGHPAPGTPRLDPPEAPPRPRDPGTDRRGVTPGSQAGRAGGIHIEKSVVIGVPPGQVFAFMERPEHQVQVTPSLSEVWDVRRSAAGRLSARAIYRLAGLDLQVRVQVTEYRPARRLCLALTGQVQGHVGWEFRPVEAGTLFTCTVACRLPASLAQGVAGSYLRAYVECDLDSTLSSLHARLEDGVVVPAVHGGRPDLTGRLGAARVTAPVDAVPRLTRPGMPAANHSLATTEDAGSPPDLGPAPVPPRQADGPHPGGTRLPTPPT